MSVRGKRACLALFSVVLFAAIVVSVLPARNVYAAQITNRTMTLQSGASDGGSKPGGVVNHLFSFTIPSTNSIGSIQFLYCTNASGTCTTPTGLVTTSATMGSQSGASGFTLTNTTNGAPYIARVSAASISSGTAVSYQLLSVTNPTIANQAFYVRITTYGSTNATGSPVDTGTVAASTATAITLTGTMPESLIFCTGGTISNNAGGIPDCSTATSGAITFNQLFSPADTATATSQLAASTNGTGGYSITVAGPTLTSGSNTIAAMASATTGSRSVSQFGLNLKANTVTTSTTPVGAEVAPAANGVDIKGQASAGYNTIDTFKFNSGDTVAKSDNGGTNGPTNIQTYTASYIVNVAGSQVSGTYTTTLTYVCTATF